MIILFMWYDRVLILIHVTQAKKGIFVVLQGIVEVVLGLV